MKIFYGIQNNNIDITDICHDKLKKNNKITIPHNDHIRTSYFSDPLVGILKYIYLQLNDGTIHEFDKDKKIIIDTNNDTFTIVDESHINDTLNKLHSTLKLKYGSFNEELPEQKMAIRYIKGNEKVLEIGGNIGRNSLIIASLLNNQKNLVVLESDYNIYKQLTENRNINNYNFFIENSALSKKKLIQNHWNTIPSDVLRPNYKWVNILDWKQLYNKYNIKFDTLVLDCEGAFYYILQDMPEILDNINLIIMENDYWDINEKKYIDSILSKKNFIVDYQEPGGWGPCQSFFFQVWIKI